ncbi:MAG: TRAP transporter substrate-binding protein DctP [Thioploca sp.]|nr:TRAP transporter substrate-binding protein DctP [Thioploca sp.]
MSVVVDSKLPWGEAATKFADFVRERIQERIKARVYPAVSLMAGKQTNEFLMLRQGIADFALVSTINWSSTIKPFNLFNLPFFFPDYTAVDQITGGVVGEQLNNLIKNKGVTILAWGENGYRELVVFLK